MDTLIHNLENGFSKLTIKTTNASNKHETIQDSLLLPLNTDKITSLNLSNCNLTELPDWFAFTNLSEVDFSCNQFQQVPQLIYTNKKIQWLNLSRNQLRDFDAKPKCCGNLLAINLSDNCLEHMPPWIFTIYLDDLLTLQLSNNPFVHQGKLMGRYLKKLKTLELSNSNIRWHRSNRFFTEIPKLEQLHLSNVAKTNINFIKEVCFNNCAFAEHLKELHLIGLGISTLPEDFVMLKNLQLLNLTRNYISWFPPNFTQLIHLKVLIVAENDLLALPRDIESLARLEKLFISSNSVGSLPPSITQIETLQTLDCYDNDFTEPLAGIIEQMPSLEAVDLDQNPFEINSEVYAKKRNTLRTENGFLGRLNGPKILNLIESDREYYSEESSNYSGSEETFEGAFVEAGPPENWDVESAHSIDDDMDLILPKFRFYARNINKPTQARSFVDPVYYEDAEN